MNIFFALALVLPADQISESGSWGLVESISDGEYDLDGECLKFDESGDPNTYLCPSAADEVTLTCGGVDVWVCNASGCDLAGQLGAVTSLDATTETTIESAIDTLANLTSVQGQSVSLSGDLTTEAACTCNSDLTTDANVQFANITSTGVVKVANGELSAPSIAFASEGGTGLYYAGAQTVDFTVVGYGILWRIQPPALSLGSYQLAFAGGSPHLYGPSVGITRAIDAVLKATNGSTGAGYFKDGVFSGADLSAGPFTCDADTHGAYVVNNDTDDTAYNIPCQCLLLDGTGYDWRAANDPVGTACPYY